MWLALICESTDYDSVNPSTRFRDSGTDSNTLWQDQQTPLHVGAKASKDVVQLLLDSKADLQARDKVCCSECCNHWVVSVTYFDSFRVRLHFCPTWM